MVELGWPHWNNSNFVCATKWGLGKWKRKFSWLVIEVGRYQSSTSPFSPRSSVDAICEWLNFFSALSLPWFPGLSLWEWHGCVLVFVGYPSLWPGLCLSVVLKHSGLFFRAAAVFSFFVANRIIESCTILRRYRCCLHCRSWARLLMFVLLLLFFSLRTCPCFSPPVHAVSRYGCVSKSPDCGCSSSSVISLPFWCSKSSAFVLFVSCGSVPFRIFCGYSL